MKRQYTHPHPNPEHVMRRYRGAILGAKKHFGSARGLIHYKGLLEQYLAAKEIVCGR